MLKSFKFLGLTLAVMTISASLASCSDDNDSPKQYSITVNTALDASAVSDGLTYDNIENAKLVFTNKSKSDTISLADAKQYVGTLPQGQYTVTFTGKVKDEAAAYVTGTSLLDLYSAKSISVSLSKIYKSPLVFKTIYTSAGAQYYMLDGFFEIVNNSDEVQYLDGLILSAPTGNQKQPNAWQAIGYTDVYESGQGAVLAFPGTGKDYPIQPGEFVVIANEATNHKLAYGEDESKKAEFAKSPDLSQADWEIYLGTGDVDYEAKNLEVIFSNNKYMKAFGLGVSGRSYLLAKLPAGMTPQEFAANSENIMTIPGLSSSMAFLMIPSKYVLDAVDVYSNEYDETEHYKTFLPKDDATGVKISERYTGKAIRRKVSHVVNGRVYYLDTNSSKNDFVNEQDNTPGIENFEK